MFRPQGMAVLLTLGLARGLSAPVPEPFTAGQERDWEFQNLAKFRGTLVKFEKGQVFIRMSDGVVRGFWPGLADGLTGSYLQRTMAKLPAKPTVSAIPPGNGPLIDLSAATLPVGPLAGWKNAGRAAGTFTVMNQPPQVAEIEGRRAVIFAQLPWLLPMDYQTLVSDFILPEGTIGGQPLTVVAWLYNTGAPVDRETFLCWGNRDCGELDTPDFSYGAYEALQWYDERVVMPQGRFPKLHQWHQFAYVVTPSDKDKARCELKLYVDGELNMSRLVRRPPAKVLSENLVFLGCAWEAWWGHQWATRPARPYHGAMAGLKIFDRALPETEIRQLIGADVPCLPSPANGSHEATPQSKLSWQPGDATARGTKLFFSTDRAAVERGDATALKAVPAGQAACDPGPLQASETYYWRVEPTGSRGPSPIWSFSVGAGGAVKPQPADGAREVQPGLTKLGWKPNPDATAQILHFGTDRAAVAKGAATVVKLKAHVEEAYVPLELKLPKLEAGQAYFWRVEQILEGKPAVAGEPWSFSTSEFDLEFDGPVSEPWPKEVIQDGFYDRIMDAGGYPILTPPGNDEVHLRAARHALRKFFLKRPDLVSALQSANTATNLSSAQFRTFGWSPFVCSAYGFGESVLREDPILMHEMGHQFHMQGAEQLEPDFRHRLGQVFNAARRDRLWMGDYGGNNMWENVAVCGTWWINGLNDMSKDEGPLRTRELLRLNDPRIYHLLADYWAGDTIIELDPARAVKADPAGQVLEWGNHAGIEYFRPNIGWRFYERSVGRFLPGAGKPVLRTVAGVTALAFTGSDRLTWDKTTWDSLDGNRSWSADFWVYRGEAPTGEQTLLEWGTPEAAAIKLTWGASEQAIALSGGGNGQWTRKPEPGRWHHLVWVFTGGGVEDGPGELRVYGDGQLESSTRVKLALPAQARVSVGSGFNGAIGRARVYNYDLHPLQIEALWAQESPAYPVDSLAVAGRLLVNLDARLLAPVEDSETWPTYPAALNKPWLRSWANRGLLGGKVHNDARVPEASQPRATVVQGAKVISFDGKSHLISSFSGSPPAEGSVEMWVFPEAGAPAPAGAALQWGAWSVPARMLRPGSWQHVVVTFEKGVVTPYLNGTRLAALGAIGAAPAGAGERLIIGGSGDGKTWTSGFRGHLAQVRIHDGVLKAEQILKNATQSDLRRPALPEPAPDAEVVVARQPALSWQPGLGATGLKSDLYLGTAAAEVAVAERNSPLFQGARNPGELRPRLSPGTRYFWRVDNLDLKGQVRMRGPVWSFNAGEGVVVDLNAADLPPGPVKAWPSKGSARGVFTPAAEREVWKPSVASVDGRNGVDFSGRKSLISSFPVPALLSGSGSFTVSIWGYFTDTRGLAKEQTMLAWGRRPAERAEFCWGHNARNGAFIGGPNLEFGYQGPVTPVDAFRHNAPLPDGWRHLLYAYNGPAKSLRIYVDGKLNREDPAPLTAKIDAICLGGVRTGRAADAPFAGLLGEVAIAGSVLSDADIARLAQGVPAATIAAPWLVRLDAKGLPAGLLASWPNQGSLGGEFAPEPETIFEPRAETVSGRPAVTFDGVQGVLRSDINTPTRLTADRPFTVEMWVLNPKLSEIETVFGLAPSVALKSYLHETNGRAANFNFGAARETGREFRPAFFASGAASRNVGWKQVTPPMAVEWQHLAYVYSGGYRGKFQVFLGGQLVNEHGFFTLDTLGGSPMSLGGAWNTAKGATNPFSGSVARLQVFDYARSEEEIRAAAARK